MEPPSQPVLLEIPEQPEVVKSAPSAPAEPAAVTRKLKPIDRSQGLLRPVIVDELVAEDHKVRAIWDLTGKLDLSKFQEGIRTQKGKAGRAAWNPRLLVSVWLYGYSEEVTSAREIERLMEYEPGLMWLSGLGEINHHTLSDFRAEHQEALKGLMVELLALLSQEGFVKLECVAHDGTKVRAQAGRDTFRREATLEKEMAKARQKVEELEAATAEGEDSRQRRREAARQRAAREREERMEQAYQQLEQVRAAKSEAERGEARVSLTEPEARLMKHGDHAIVPSYNVQISTDVEQKIVVGIHLTQCSSDSGSLEPAMEEVKATAGRYPAQAVADGGFTNQGAIEKMEEKQIDFYGSLVAPEVKQAAAMKAVGIDPAFAPSAFVVVEEKKSLRCPAGHLLEFVRHSKKEDATYHQYQARGGECVGCGNQRRCCPRKPEVGRTVSVRISENAKVAAFREKMKGEEAQAIYRKRGAVAEFPNCWIKEKIGLRKFRLRGIGKATTEALWAVITYNVQQWVRLSWRAKRKAAMVAAAAA